MVTRKEIFEYVNQKFGTKPEFLWPKFPSYAVLRNTKNSKWYAVLMKVEKKKLGLEGDENIEILNIKCDPIMIGSLLDGIKYFPGYHMNKANWVSIRLGGNVSREEVFNLIDLSYEMSQKNSKKKK